MAQFQILDADMPDEDYHSHGADGRSQLVDFYKDRPTYEGRYITGRVPKFAATQAMGIGDAGHLFTLRPGLADERIVSPPDSVLGKGGKRNTNAYKDWKAENVTAGVIELKDVEEATARKAANAARGALREWLNHSDVQIERPIVWTEEVEGQVLIEDEERDGDGPDVPRLRSTGETYARQCRLRADFYIDAPGYVLVGDLKFSGSPVYGTDVRDPLLWMQAAHYSRGISIAHDDKPVRFVFVRVLTGPPYSVKLISLGPEAMAKADRIWRENLGELAECYRSNDFSDRDAGIIREVDHIWTARK